MGKWLDRLKQLNEDEKNSDSLYKWLSSRLSVGETAISKGRILQRVTPASLRKVDKLNSAIELLERKNKIRLEKDGRTLLVEVIPEIQEQECDDRLMDNEIMKYAVIGAMATTGGDAEEAARLLSVTVDFINERF